MKNFRLIASLAAVALFVAGFLMVPATMRAADTPDSPEITSLLLDARTQAVDLRRAAEDMETFTRGGEEWQSFAAKLDILKERVNATGKLVAKMKDAEAHGAIWQQTAIRRVEPLLREMAANTDSTIRFLNANKTKVHFPEFRDYVRTNADMAVSLESLVKNFLTYGELKQKLDRLGNKLEIGG